MIEAFPRPLLLMLDYDGTLTPIVEDYTQAQISPDRLAWLKQVSQLPDVQLAIVSGRSVSQLLKFMGEALAGLPVYFAGLHGGQLYNVATEQMILTPPDVYIDKVTALQKLLVQGGLDLLPDISFENKLYDLVLHYRGASQDTANQAIHLFEAAFEALSLEEDFELRPGKMVLELVPKSFNKGKAVENLLRQVTPEGHTEPYCAYYGDDRTDWDALNVVMEKNGYAAWVGANLSLDAPAIPNTVPDSQGVYIDISTKLSLSAPL